MIPMIFIKVRSITIYKYIYTFAASTSLAVASARTLAAESNRLLESSSSSPSAAPWIPLTRSELAC